MAKDLNLEMKFGQRSTHITCVGSESPNSGGFKLEILENRLFLELVWGEVRVLIKIYCVSFQSK